jgi:hypothetical protein
VHGRWLEERLGIAFRGSGVADDVENGGRVGNVERGARAAEDLEGGLAHFGDERVDVDERLDIAARRAGVRDHHAPVGVAHQDDGTGRALGEERCDVGGVSRHPAQEVGRGEDGETLALEFGRHNPMAGIRVKYAGDEQTRGGGAPARSRAAAPCP